MAEVVGGLWLTQYEINRALGVEPASASGTGVLPAGVNDPGITLGGYVVFSFLGNNFHGIISSSKVGDERTTGKTWSFSILDNRIRLRWMLCFGQWNMAEDGFHPHKKKLPRPAGVDFNDPDLTVDLEVGLGVDFDTTIDNPPGTVAPSSVDDGSIRRGRSYSHVMSSGWPSQLRTTTDEPIAASDIIRNAMAFARGGFGFGLNFHADQSKPVFDVDANGCISAAALLSQVASAQGLDIALDGVRTLRFVRRGEGTLVIPAGAHLRENGAEMSAEPTKVRVVGGRTLVQVNNIVLEPDWAPDWEIFISEPEWLDEVMRVWDMPRFTSAERAEIAARSREITVREYIEVANPLDQNLDPDPIAFVDHGYWGETSRMNLPVWKYLNEIVYRSYRIPEETLYGGIPMRSLEINDKLLCAVCISGDSAVGETDGDIIYRQAREEFYPDASAYVIAKGQPLDLINVLDRGDPANPREKDISNIWSEVPDFTLDAVNHSIRFNTPIFKDGAAAENKSILLFPNEGQGGYEDATLDLPADSDWRSVILPNPGYEIAPAEIKVSLVFKLGLYFMDFGGGQRWTSSVVPNIAQHILEIGGGDAFTSTKLSALGGDTGLSLSNTTGANFDATLGTPGEVTNSLMEILYEDGRTAADLASGQAHGIVQRNGLETSGSYVLYGAAGTGIGGVVSRVTTTLDFENRLQETIELAKPRPSSGFISSADLARRAQTEELYGGQKELQREIDQLRAIAKLYRTTGTAANPGNGVKVITDLSRKPIGGENPTVKTYTDTNGQFPEGRAEEEKWRAGDLIWLDAAGLPSKTGTNFGGVVVANSESKHVIASTGGMVPAAVKPGTDPAKALMAVPGEWFASNEGAYPIGQLSHGSPAPGTGEAVIGLVRIGAGGGAAAADKPLQIVSSRPIYIPEPPSPQAEGASRLWVVWGSINNAVATNWSSYFDLAADALVYADITLNTTSTTEIIASWTIATGESLPDQPAWPLSGPGAPLRPTKLYILLGNYVHETKSVMNNGLGSLIVGEYVTGMYDEFNTLGAVLTKALTWSRVNY